MGGPLGKRFGQSLKSLVTNANGESFVLFGRYDIYSIQGYKEVGGQTNRTEEGLAFSVRWFGWWGLERWYLVGDEFPHRQTSISTRHEKVVT